MLESAASNLINYVQVPETNSIKAVLVDEEAVGSVDAPGCGAKVLYDVDELEQCSNGGIVRDLKVFSPDAQFNTSLPIFSLILCISLNFMDM